MTLSASTRYFKYSPVVSTASFVIPFPVFDFADILVRVAGASMTAFSIGGTFSAGRCDDAYITLATAVTGVDVEIYSKRTAARGSNFATNSAKFGDNMQADADKLTAVQQEAQRDIARSIKTDVSEGGTDMVLPGVLSRANKYLRFDGFGLPSVADSQITTIYYGPLSADPTTRPDGSARVAGDIYFRTTTLELRVYNGTGWQAGLPSASLTFVNYAETAATAKTVFTIAGGYTVGSTLIYLNGLLLAPSAYTASNGTTVTLGAACSIGDKFRCVSYSSFSVADTLSKAANLADLPSVGSALTNLGLSTFFKTLLAAADAGAMQMLLALGFGATAAKSTSGQAAAGVDDTTVMTPAMTAAAIVAQAPGLTGVRYYQAFTASGTWTKPAGLDANTMVTVEAWGAGGGGGKNISVCCGGGGGGYQRAIFRLGDLASTIAVTIGAGGAGGTSSSGSTGGNTTFGALMTAYGGGGGQGGTGTSGGSGGGAFAAGAVGGAAPTGGGAGGTSGVGGDPTWPQGGGGGGGPNTNTNGSGGNALFGGGGGAGRAASNNASIGGVSVYGGNGGIWSGTTGGAGAAPGGGGGAGITAGGVGARGELRIWV